MKPFTSYPKLNERFPGQLNTLVSTILETVRPSVIYLLGTSIKYRRTETIFCEDSPTGSYTSEYYLLILLEDLKQKSTHEWQEQLEQYCSKAFTIISIVLETGVFNAWMDKPHSFVIKVANTAIPIYSSDDTLLTLPILEKRESYNDVEKYYNEGLNKVNEFLTGAELFISRSQNKMAIFMIHQAAEQCLRTLLKVSTGFRYNTHNLDRLIRYCNMVSYKLPDIFPKNNAKEQYLFKLLQSSYIEARYSSHFNIHLEDVKTLLVRVKQIKDIFVTTGPTYFKRIALS